MPAGRPSGYNPAYCEQVVDFLAQGYSLAAFAGSLRTSRASVYRWVDEHPEFRDAVKDGQAAAVYWWESAGKKLAETGEGNATAIIFGLKNRAADEWRDVKATEISGVGGEPIKLQSLPVAKLSEATLREIAAASNNE